jgi:hypothetical protein
MNAELRRQVDAMMTYIRDLAPEVVVRFTGVIYEDEDANLQVYPPLGWDEDRCLELQHRIAQHGVDVLLETGHLILVSVRTPEQQIAEAKHERTRADKVLRRASALGLLQPA